MTADKVQSDMKLHTISQMDASEVFGLCASSGMSAMNRPQSLNSYVAMAALSMASPHCGAVQHGLSPLEIRKASFLFLVERQGRPKEVSNLVVHDLSEWLEQKLGF